jgi:hypothetical protein
LSATSARTCPSVGAGVAQDAGPDSLALVDQREQHVLGGDDDDIAHRVREPL